jgi:lysozyme family protein
MANGKIIIKKVLSAEGFRIGVSVGYVNVKTDFGGETVGGISRRYWPNFHGWGIVDAVKNIVGFQKVLANNQELYDMIVDFYDVNFWDKIGGDGIKSDTIAELIVKAAVNEGIPKGIKRAESIVHIPETGIASELLKTKLNLLP